MENSQKRQREESHEDSISSGLSSSSKRQKSCNIINLLEPEPEPSGELSQDLSAIFTTFQQELSSSTSCDSTLDFESLPSTADGEAAEHSQKVECGGGDELDESVKSVLRHLLEASDDELGIPNARDENGFQNLNSMENLPFAFTDDDGLWELEDVAANYCSVLQSVLFM